MKTIAVAFRFEEVVSEDVLICIDWPLMSTPNIGDLINSSVFYSGYTDGQLPREICTETPFFQVSKKVWEIGSEGDPIFTLYLKASDKISYANHAIF